jgi:hypothetical protein
MVTLGQGFRWMCDSMPLISVNDIRALVRLAYIQFRAGQWSLWGRALDGYVT